MKKLLAMILALSMMCTAGAAFAETSWTPDLYDLYDQQNDGLVWVGTAIPITGGVAITSPVGLPEKTTELEIWDGAAYRKVSGMLTTADGKVLVLLHETDGGKPGFPAYDFAESGTVPPADNLIVRSGDWMRSRVNRAVYDATAITWNNREALLMTLSGDTPIGSPVITWDGALVGIVTAEYAEGVNRYVALTVSEITKSLEEAVRLLEESEGIVESRPEGYEITVQDNTVTFDWSRMELPQVAEGEKLYHIVADSESSYLTYMEVTEEIIRTTMLLTPGRTYISGFAGFAGVPDDLPEQVAITTLPEARPMTDYDFKSLAFTLAEIPDAEGIRKGEMPTPVTEVTEEFLRSGKACFYSATSYNVDREVDNCSLLVTLTDPEGSNYRYESGWYYDPTIMQKDEWYTSMDDSGLLEMLNGNGYPAGTYEMAMYIDGKLADSFSFTLIK